MIRTRKYNELTTKQILTEEEQKQKKEYEEMIKNAYKYQNDASKEVNQIINKFQEQIIKLQILPPEQQNENIKATINLNDQIQKNIESEQRKQNNDLKLSLSLNTSKGFTNATVIIFIVLLIGIIASVLLLSLS